ncbi:MAG: PIG-L family deacetylase [Planctomycetes bacterium]|nr:PIG-L family deacetylase [Planctomycetota bacterium]
MMSKRMLILAPHTDDGEFGCGGTIARYIEEGWEAHYVAFSGCRESLDRKLPPDTLIHELGEATSVLGIDRSRVQVLDFPVRRFPELRQEILEVLVKLKANIKPDLVFLPSVDDTHQDHQQVAQEGFRAFKATCMLGYEMPWNNLTFTTTSFCRLEREHLQKKIAAMKCYKSQSHRSYSSEEFILALARTRGTQIGVPWAEAFQLSRWVM